MLEFFLLEQLLAIKLKQPLVVTWLHHENAFSLLNYLV